MKLPTTLILSAIIGTTIGFAPVQPTTRNVPTSLNFFGTSSATKKSKSSPFADEAIELYNNKFNVGKARQNFFWESWGMPESYQPADSDAKIFAREQSELLSTFNTIASLYGEENALQMCTIQPSILAFNKDNFGPCLTAFGEKFGDEEAKAMVIRNPGLLSCSPASAKITEDSTMQLSYVVEFTRPIGIFGPIILVSLLCVPAIESALGLQRGGLITSLF